MFSSNEQGGLRGFEGGRVHVIPINDLRPHTDSPECWCRPTQDTEEPDVWVHHAMDGREAYEEGREMS